MLNRGALYLLIIALAVLASPGLAPPAAAQPIRWLVGADSASCAGQIPDFSTIFEAVLTASSGDTIHVCPGDYTEDSIFIYDDELTIEGSGASVTHLHWTGNLAAMFFIVADHVVIEGLDLDATPAHPGDASSGILIGRDSTTIQNNEIRNATGAAVATSHAAKPNYVQVLSNNIHDNSNGVACRCGYSALSGNTVNAGGNPAFVMEGEQSVITSNVVVDGTVAAYGDDLSVSNNQISGATVGPLIDVAGNRIGVTDNTLSDTTGYGIQAETYAGGISTDVTIARNTFSHVDKPIHLLDSIPGDGFSLTATIGGSASEANTFIDSGGSLGDSNYLVQMDGAPLDVNAEYNNWGLCTAAEIEQEIYDKADNPVLGAVDFDPFIKPSSCSTPTPTPTRTPTPTPTPTSSPTPSPTPTPTPGAPRMLEWGPGWHNATWSGASTPEEVFACATGKYAAAYRYVDGVWERYFPNRPDISNMGPLSQYDAFLILIAQPVTCTMPVAVASGTSRILQWDVGWHNEGWTGADGTAPQDAFACASGSYAAAYRLVNGVWERYFPNRPDISNMGPLNKYDAFLILVTAPVSCTMPIAS